MRRLTLRSLPARFAVCKLAPDAGIPGGLDESVLYSVTRTENELSLVCRDARDLPGQVERGWCCLEVEGPFEFTLVGVLASLTQPLAEAGVSIFALSTFDTDYLLVKEAQYESAVAALQAAGHRIS